MNLTPEQIAKVLGEPLSRVQALWPKIDLCLRDLIGADYTDAVSIAALATLRVECPPFYPIKEWAGKEGDDRFVRLYWDNEHVRNMLGNRSLEDAIKYCGRGPIQLTGYSNYVIFGRYIGVNLVDDPDQALELNTAAALFAAYFHVHHKCTESANTQDWIGVRRAVNGGLNDVKAFLAWIQLLAGEAGRQDYKASAAAQLQQIKDAEAKKAASAGGGAK